MPWKGADRAAWDEVQRLGHESVTPSHGLLALLRLHEGAPVREALEAAGFQAGRVEAWVRQEEGERRQDWDNGTTLGWERVIGRVEAFTATLGHGTERPADLLFGLLWDRWVWPWFFYHHGARPEVVLEAISAQVPVPTGPLPEPDPASRIRGMQRRLCPTDRVKPVLDLLSVRGLGGGVAYGWTLEGEDHAWFVAPEGVPLQAIIDEAVASPAS
jgi:hypothetical protein